MKIQREKRNVGAQPPHRYFGKVNSSLTFGARKRAGLRTSQTEKYTITIF